MSIDQEATRTRSKAEKRGGSRACTGDDGGTEDKKLVYPRVILHSLFQGFFFGGGGQGVMRKGRLKDPEWRGHADRNHPTTNPFIVPPKSSRVVGRVGEISTLCSDQGHTSVKIQGNGRLLWLHPQRWSKCRERERLYSTPASKGTNRRGRPDGLGDPS